jgi:hypothetical protein
MVPNVSFRRYCKNIRTLTLRYLVSGLAIGALFYGLNTYIETGIVTRQALLFFLLAFTTMASFGFLAQFLLRCVDRPHVCVRV